MRQALELVNVDSWRKINTKMKKICLLLLFVCVGFATATFYWWTEYKYDVYQAQIKEDMAAVTAYINSLQGANPTLVYHPNVTKNCFNKSQAYIGADLEAIRNPEQIAPSLVDYKIAIQRLSKRLESAIKNPSKRQDNIKLVAHRGALAGWGNKVRGIIGTLVLAVSLNLPMEIDMPLFNKYFDDPLPKAEKQSENEKSYVTPIELAFCNHIAMLDCLVAQNCREYKNITVIRVDNDYTFQDAVLQHPSLRGTWEEIIGGDSPDLHLRVTDAAGMFVLSKPKPKFREAALTKLTKMKLYSTGLSSKPAPLITVQLRGWVDVIGESYMEEYWFGAKNLHACIITSINALLYSRTIEDRALKYVDFYVTSDNPAYVNGSQNLIRESPRLGKYKFRILSTSSDKFVHTTNDLAEEGFTDAMIDWYILGFLSDHVICTGTSYCISAMAAAGKLAKSYKMAAQCTDWRQYSHEAGFIDLDGWRF